MLYKKIAAMPKEKKTILIVVVIIAVLAGGLLGYRLYVTAKHSVEDVIDALFVIPHGALRQFSKTDWGKTKCYEKHVKSA